MTWAAQPLLLVEQTSTVLARWGGSVDALSPAERRRAASFRFSADRWDYVAGHLLARECAAAYLGRVPASVALVQRCSSCGSGGHGIPSVAGLPWLGISLSHSRGVVAACAGQGDVGVDVEHRSVRPPLDDATLTSVLTARELGAVRGAPDRTDAFLRLWVRKEALVKVGAVDLDGLCALDVSRLPGDIRAGRRAWRVRDHVDEHAVAAAAWLA